MPRTAEIAFNTEIADVLRRKHPRWADRIGVEQTNVFSGEPRLQPDIIVRHPGGLPVAIETEYTPAHTVEQDACQRLGKSLTQTGDQIEQAIAVRIPIELAGVGQNELDTILESENLEFCLLSGNPSEPERWPKSDWFEGTVDDLAVFIELAALSESRIGQGMQILEDGIHQAATKLRDACTDTPTILEDIATELHQKDGIQTSRMSMAILANALTFHSAIAGAHGIETLDQLRGGDGRVSKMRVLRVWRRILTDINYWPIFRIASDILLPISDSTAKDILERLVLVSDELVSVGATSHHDLCGRMLQRLITDRKFLATFYTLPSSATLLAELAISRLPVDWSKRDEITQLRIGDFACGTGALLNAAYNAVLSRYRRNGGDDKEIHPEMMERALVGADIMPAATHLTASVLSSTHPSVTFGNTSIFTLPYGEQPEATGRPIAIGSLDLIKDQHALSLFGTGLIRLQGSGETDSGPVDIPHEGFDIVIMNPPFTRSTGQEAAKVGIPAPAFAGFATRDDEMRLMSQRLNGIRDSSMVGHGNAGLASHFIDLAHTKVRSSGGVLALVLPAAILQGGAWAAARRLLDEYYNDVIVVSIASTGATDLAFSADTDMAEVLVVATKSNVRQPCKPTRFVNISRRPKSVLEAVSIARGVYRIPSDQPFASVMIGGNDKIGCSIQSTLSDTGCAGLRNIGVVQGASGLVRGKLQLPRQDSPIPIPVTLLGELGHRGLYHMDISGTECNSSGSPRGPFDIVNFELGEFPTWPVLWRHNAVLERKIIVKPDSAGEVRVGCASRAVGCLE